MYEYRGFNHGCRMAQRAGDPDLIGALPETENWTEEEAIGLLQVHKDDIEDLIPNHPSDRL